jgi:hypothetical protein
LLKDSFYEINNINNDTNLFKKNYLGKYRNNFVLHFLFVFLQQTIVLMNRLTPYKVNLEVVE